MTRNETLIINDQSLDGARRMLGWPTLRCERPEMPDSHTARALREALARVDASISGPENASEHQSSRLHHFFTEAFDLDTHLGERFNGVNP